MQPTASSARFDNAANYGNQLGFNNGCITNNFYHVQADGQSSSVPWTSGNVHWTVPRPVSTLFTGRAAVMKEMENIIRTSSAPKTPPKPCRIVITGMGGQGKSEMCLRLANDLRDLFWGVFWVDVNTASQAEAGFVAIAKQIQKPATTIAEVHQILANINYPWLLMLDNADHPNHDYQTYLPSGVYGVVLMTSRNSECAQYATAHHLLLEGLEEEDGVQLLLKVAQIPQQHHHVQIDQARAICSLLSSHPLALIQAGSYVAKKHCTLATYPQIYRRYRHRLLRFHPGQAHSRYKDVYATFEASMDIIKASHPEGDDAILLLSILSALQWSPLPLNIFEFAWSGAKNALSQSADHGAREKGLCAWHVEQIADILKPEEPEWDSFRLTNALQLLESLALISLHTSEDSVTLSMHPLAHAWAKDRLALEEQNQAWIAAACLMACVQSSDCSDATLIQLLRPHLLSLYDRELDDLFVSNPSKMVAAMLISGGWLLGWLRLDHALAILLAKLFHNLGLDSLRPQADWIDLYHLHASNLQQLCSISAMTTVAVQILQIREYSLPAEHRERLTAQRLLVSAYRLAGRYPAAIKLLTKIISKQSLKETATGYCQMLADRWELSALYMETGQGQKAVETAEAAYHQMRASSLTSQQARQDGERDLAAAYISDRQFQRAIGSLEDLAVLEETTLPDLHPDRLKTLAVLGSAYQGSGQSPKAITLLEHVRAEFDNIFDVDHKDRLQAIGWLAAALWDDNQKDKTVEVMEEIIRAEDISMPENHAYRWASTRFLAEIYFSTGKIRRSIELFEKIIEQSAENSNQEPRLLPEVLTLLGAAYSRDGQTPKAIETLENALSRAPAVDGQRRRPWLKLEQELACMLWSTNQRQRAVKMISGVVVASKTALGSDDPVRQESIEALKRMLTNDDVPVEKLVEADLKKIPAYIDVETGLHKPPQRWRRRFGPRPR